MQRDSPRLHLPNDILQNIFGRLTTEEYAETCAPACRAFNELQLGQISVCDVHATEQSSKSAAVWLIKHWKSAQEGSLDLSLATMRPCAVLKRVCEEFLQPTTLATFSAFMVPEGYYLQNVFVSRMSKDVSERQRAKEELAVAHDRARAGSTLEDFGCWLLSQMPRLITLKLHLGHPTPGMALQLSQHLQHLHMHVDAMPPSCEAWPGRLEGLQGLKTLVLSTTQVMCRVASCDFSGLHQLKYVRLDNVVPLKLALPAGCRLDLQWELRTCDDADEDMCPQGDYKVGFFNNWQSALPALHTCVFCWDVKLWSTRSPIDRVADVLPAILKEPTGAATEVCFQGNGCGFNAAGIDTGARSPEFEQGLGVPMTLDCPGMAHVTSLCIQGFYTTHLHFPASLHLSTLQVCAGRLSLSFADLIAFAASLEHLVIVYDSEADVPFNPKKPPDVADWTVVQPLARALASRGHLLKMADMSYKMIVMGKVIMCPTIYDDMNPYGEYKSDRWRHNVAYIAGCKFDRGNGLAKAFELGSGSIPEWPFPPLPMDMNKSPEY